MRLAAAWTAASCCCAGAAAGAAQPSASVRGDGVERGEYRRRPSCTAPGLQPRRARPIGAGCRSTACWPAHYDRFAFPRGRRRAARPEPAARRRARRRPPRRRLVQRRGAIASSAEWPQLWSVIIGSCTGSVALLSRSQLPTGLLACCRSGCRADPAPLIQFLSCSEWRLSSCRSVTFCSSLTHPEHRSYFASWLMVALVLECAGSWLFRSVSDAVDWNQVRT